MGEAGIQLDLLTDWQPPKDKASASDLPPGCPPDVAELFLHLALSVQARGFARYSSDAILHRIRWHHHVERGNRDFKCNNNLTAGLARWAMVAEPKLVGFFETRERRT